MKYMALIYSQEGSGPAWGTPEFQTMMQGYTALNDALRAAGAHVAGDALQAVDTATTLRIRDGRTKTMDGALDGYPQFHAARADLLRRLARGPESDAAYDRAIALAPTSADAAFLRARRSARVIVRADDDFVRRDQKKGRASARPKSNREV